MIIIPEMEIRDLKDLFPRYADRQVNTSGEGFFLNGEQFMLCKTFDIDSALFLINFFACTFSVTILIKIAWFMTTV